MDRRNIDYSSESPRDPSRQDGWGLAIKTVQPNSFSKLISALCNFKNNAQVTHLFVSNL